MNLTLSDYPSILKNAYQPLKKLAQKKSGFTLLAYDAHQKKVVIKTIDSLKTLQPVLEKLETLAHPNIHEIIQWGPLSEKKAFLVVEYIHGKSFFEFCKQANPDQKLDLFTQLSLTLYDLHQAGITHGDLKSENILITPKSILKLIDFDLSLKTKKSFHQLPQGSLINLAPEILKGQVRDHRSDIYALGMLAALLFLPECFKFTRPDEWIDFHLKGILPKEKLKGLPLPFGEIIPQCLHKNPHHRYQSALEIAKRLNRHLQKPYDLNQKGILYTSHENELLGKIKNYINSIEKALGNKNTTRLHPEALRRLGKYEEILGLLKNNVESELLINQLQAIQARVLIDKGQYNEALQTPCHTVEQLNAHGLANFYLGHYDQAQKLFNKAASKAHTELQKGSTSNYLGLLFFNQGHFDKARVYFQEADHFFEKLNDPQPRVSSLMNLAALYQTEGKLSDAYKFYERSLHLAKKINHHYLTANLLSNLANLYILFGAIQEARTVLDESLQIASEHQLPYWLAYNEILKGDLAFLQNNSSLARLCYNQAIDLFKQQKLKREQAIAGNNLFELLFYSGASLPELESQAHTPAQQKIISLFKKKSVLIKPQDETEVILAYIKACQGKNQDQKLYSLSNVIQARLDDFRGNIPVEFRSLAVKHPRWQYFINLKNEILKEDPVKIARLTKLLHVTKKMSTEHHLNKLLEFIMDAVIEISGAERGFLILKKAQTKEDAFFVDVARNIDLETIQKPQYKISRTLVQKVLREAKPILTTDASADPRLNTAQSVVGLKLKSLLCCPLIRRKEAMGAIYLENRFQKGVFEDSLVEILESFADQAAIAIENAKLHEENLRSAGQIIKLNQDLEQALARKTMQLEDIERRLSSSQWELQKQYSYESIIGNSAPMREVFSLLDRLKEREVTVLVTGESGTGKELIARALHFGGLRKNAEFVAINCAAIPEHLLESELFGYVRGAFTGADRDRAGLIEQAQGGTLFLDEIGDMPLTMQAKLLRVLQEREIRPVGGQKRISIDVRFISATNKNLAYMVTEKKFREDLLYRLNPVTIALPALRNRKDDIPALIHHTLKKLSPEKEVFLNRQTLEALVNYDWPGNIRELVNELERCISLTDNEIGPEHLSEKILTQFGVAPLEPSQGLKNSRQNLEKSIILKTIHEAGGNKTIAAKKLGLSRVALYQKMNKYKLPLTS